MKDFFKIHRSVLLATGAVACLYLALFALGITCPIKYTLGISCPGCGMSRALFYLITLRPTTAFSYHPLVFLLIPFAASATVLWHKGRKKAFRALLISGFSLLVAVWLYRLLLHKGHVVVFEPQNGLIGRVIGYILSSRS